MLHLEYRKVAQSNIDHFDQVAAFKGVKLPGYHYAGGWGCAIGVHDVDKILANQSSCIASLLHHEKITVDNFQRNNFIQLFHDYKFVLPYRGRTMIDLMEQKSTEVPPCVLEIVEGIKTHDDLTVEVYKDVMNLLVHEHMG